ncbi:MAG: decarboxylase [Neobacillus sp.]|jgi:OHCU decarboxylase|nr:decarboxylase [Neobacillus sp.]
MVCQNSGESLSIENINQMNRELFVQMWGWLFEDSPWVASKAWESLPFESKDELLQTMINIVGKTEKPRQLALLCAHPDLGTRLQMSETSQKEQAGVGLDKLTKEELAEFVSLNQIYVEKFGFPFIMAVKGQNKETILSAMKERLGSTYDQEFETALDEVYKIARFRLGDTI